MAASDRYSYPSQRPAGMPQCGHAKAWSLIGLPHSRQGTMATVRLPSLRGLLVHEPAVLDAVRLVGLGADALVQVLLVILVVALEEHDLRIALERQHVRRDAVEEP